MLDLSRFGDAETCLKHLARSRRELVGFVETLSDDDFFSSPAQGVWSAAEILEHVLKVEESGGKIIRRLRKVARGEAELPPGLPAGETRPDGRPLSPALTEPKGGLSRGELTAGLEACRTRLIAEVHQSGALIDQPPSYAHPFFRELTALGWLQSLVFHERHHLEQLRERFPKAF